jgi:hypothetical protein
MRTAASSTPSSAGPVASSTASSASPSGSTISSQRACPTAARNTCLCSASGLRRSRSGCSPNPRACGPAPPLTRMRPRARCPSRARTTVRRSACRHQRSALARRLQPGRRQPWPLDPSSHSDHTSLLRALWAQAIRDLRGPTTRMVSSPCRAGDVMSSSCPATPWPRCCDRRVGRNSALILSLSVCFAPTRAQEVFPVSLQISYLSWHQPSYCTSSLFRRT